jgi:hypothetical protein
MIEFVKGCDGWSTLEVWELEAKFWFGESKEKIPFGIPRRTWGIILKRM